MTYILATWTLDDEDQTEIELDVDADRDGNAEITGIRVKDDGRWRDLSDKHFEALKAEMLNNLRFWRYVFDDLFDEAAAGAAAHYRDLMREYA